MACTFKAIIDWITFIALIVLAVFYVIFYAYVGGFWVDRFFIFVFYVLSCVFTGLAQFHWVPFIDELFAFMFSPIWRGCYVIVIGCFMFPDTHWDGIPWYAWIAWIVAIVVIVMGIIYLVTDLVACCKGGCKCPGGDSGDLLDCAASGSGSGGSRTTRTTTTTRTTKQQVVYSSK